MQKLVNMGHEHHKSVHRLVKEIFPNAKFFKAMDKKLPRDTLEQKRKLNKWYAGSQNISKMIYNGEVGELGRKERIYYENEKIYEVSQKPKIAFCFLLYDQVKP